MNVQEIYPSVIPTLTVWTQMVATSVLVNLGLLGQEMFALVSNQCIM